MTVRSRAWQVRIEENAAEIFLSGQLTRDDLEVIKEWRRAIVEGSGPEALLKRPDRWADHALHGRWEGHRASSFGYRGRIIYRVENEIVTVVVVRITPEHDYGKRKQR